MCTLCLSDMGELRDDWLREPRPPMTPAATPGIADAAAGTAVVRLPATFNTDFEAAAA